jgi:tetratricopeptide (TPR) repeat protein
VFQGVSAVLILTLSVLSFVRAGVFARGESLWRDTLAKNPSAWTAHNNLACILAARNEFNEAIEHFEASLKYNPYNASAHCNLGRALMLQKKFALAEEQFQAALKIKFADADIQQTYASALAQRGKIDAAIVHLREAVRLEPTVDLRLQFAGLLHQAGKLPQAIAQYRQVLTQQPDSLEALNNLSWLLATSPDAAVRNGNDAVKFAEKACQLTDRKQARPVGTLAAAYAEAGRFSDAVAAASRAVELANAAGDKRFAAANAQLLELYRSGRAFHEPPRNPR